MITIALWALRIKSVLTQLIAWAIANWKLVLVVLLVAAVFHYKIKSEHLKQDFDNHLMRDVSALEMRKLENKIRTEQFTKALQESEAKHLAQMKVFQLDRQREAKAIKEQYENDKTGFMFRLNAYADRMRLEQERSPTDGLPTPQADTSGSTEAERDCYSAYTSLEKACRITTIDYNRLRAWGDATCDLVICK